MSTTVDIDYQYDGVIARNERLQKIKASARELYSRDTRARESALYTYNLAVRLLARLIIRCLAHDRCNQRATNYNCVTCANILGPLNHPNMWFNCLRSYSEGEELVVGSLIKRWRERMISPVAVLRVATRSFPSGPVWSRRTLTSGHFVTGNNSSFSITTSPILKSTLDRCHLVRDCI